MVAAAHSSWWSTSCEPSYCYFVSRWHLTFLRTKSYSVQEAIGQYWMKDLNDGAYRHEAYIAHIGEHCDYQLPGKMYQVFIRFDRKRQCYPFDAVSCTIILVEEATVRLGVAIQSSSRCHCRGHRHTIFTQSRQEDKTGSLLFPINHHSRGSSTK